MKLIHVKNKKYEDDGGFRVSMTKEGVFSFSRKTTSEFIKNHEKMKLYKDEEEPSSWFLQFHKDGDLIIRKSKSNAFFSSKNLSTQIKISNNYKKDDLVKAVIGKLLKDEESELEVYPLLIKKAEKTID